MPTYVIREIIDGVLLGLKPLVARLPLGDVTEWVFRSVEMSPGTHFGLPATVFEEATAATRGGFRVTDARMREFLNTDFQIIDGWIDAIASDGCVICTIYCLDTGQWEVTTSEPTLAAWFEREGYPQLKDQ